MKIEKVNDRQIRCTLTKNDLVSRNLKMSELAYGTDKAKNLFRDMMREAHHRFGFEVEDIPLMIEAIPISNDAIVLVITKVEDPEELDTRFSKFAPYLEDGEQQDARKKKDPGSADDIIDLLVLNMMEGIRKCLYYAVICYGYGRMAPGPCTVDQIAGR